MRQNCVGMHTCILPAQEVALERQKYSMIDLISSFKIIYLMFSECSRDAFKGG